MPQVFDLLKPISGTTKLSQLYQIIRDHNDANRSNFSGTIAPATPVVGQIWEDTGNDKLFLYTASGWSEITVANSGLGLEIINARGSLASLDQRFDVSQNEDGTLKASTSLNPSQWYTNTVASGIASSTSFISYGSNMTTTYHPLRRLKINRSGGVFFTEVVSSSYGGGNTTVVVRDAVIIATLISVEHSIVAPRKAAAGDGAVSYEMVANRNVYSPVGDYTVLIGDSIILASGTFPVHGIVGTTFGAGRDLLIVNIGTGVITYDPGAYTINGSTTDLVLAAGQTLHIVPDGSNWRRIDQPVCESWTNFGALGTNWSIAGQPSYLKQPDGIVRLQGTVYVASGTGHTTIYSNLPSGYRPAQTTRFLVGYNTGSGTAYFMYIDTSGLIITTGGTATNTYFYFDGVSFKAA